jgi:hypothetical protein
MTKLIINDGCLMFMNQQLFSREYNKDHNQFIPKFVDFDIKIDITFTHNHITI